ncbi:segregation and condensation protein A [Fibrobacter succinogenes]|uniref:Segregation and condensation protein A n=1 Tax=Fibrobacter succinogenes TaxID=833 RepID=A0A380S5N9_FIBSU|nr:segregation/condensation protein A [Fibrobacter succinogenes]PWJ35485.1 condensin subunit ScpA [Fibrobacter succinogenes subsp. elongatus]SUQ24140.1 condensin subunit ScpA [Fibrobacter succinogenes]
MVDSEVLEQEDYEVKIGSFNGPMDLLVYLVQKKEMTLDQIPIAEIADDFLKWVNEYSETDLSKAGDFLFMASRLMALKVQELLPAEERDPEMEEEYNEDREKLMKEMLEYQRFKQVASGLQEMEAKNFGTYSRGRLEKTQSDDDTLADANIWQLFRAYQKSLKTKISETIHHIELDYVTIQDRQQAINNFLNVHGRALFEDLLDNDSHPIVAAVTFMAMLEMIKTDDIVFRQSELFGPIWIYRKKNNPEYADEMAHETVFFSKDPEVKAGLVETIRSQAIARSKEKSVGDLAATMREAVLWTERGRNVTEEDLNAMLEGREDISEVQDNPFADMIAEADAAEGAQQAASAPAGDTAQQPTASENAETAPSQNATTANDNAAAPVENTEAVSAQEAAQSATLESAEMSASEDEAPVLSKSSIPEFGANDDDDSEERAHTFEPVDELVEELEEENLDEDEIESGEAESVTEETTESSDDSSAESSFQGLNEQSVQQMSDEEFAAFMQKAQAFYNNASSAQSNNTQSAATSAQSTTSSTQAQTSATQPISADSRSTSSYGSAEPEEDRYSSYSFGNEMTDEEYIAYLNRSARASRKEESKSTASPTNLEKQTENKPAKKSERKSFMPEDEEGGMTDEEYQAYLAEHGDDDDDEEGPVVYGAGKD